MSGSTFGKIFKVSTWGESHGKALGVTIDGCPSGILLCEEDIQVDLDRRKPGTSKYATKRNEADKVEILSGIFEGKTTGTPISLIIHNTDQRSYDYSNIKNMYRPGHADYTYDAKYGFRDYRGGGRSSGRETASRVAAAAVAKKFLSEIGIKVKAYTYSIGDIVIDRNNFDDDFMLKNSLVMPDAKAYEKATVYLDECIKNCDSAGGVVECLITGVPAGVGEPVFDKLDAVLAHGIFSIGAVKGMEFGLGCESSKVNGSFWNDEYYYNETEEVKKRTNHAGGTLGGISDGDDIVFKAYFKPTSSIGKTQKSINNKGENVAILIDGRHDPIIVARAVVVVEAMAALSLADLCLYNTTSKIENIKKIYRA